MYVCMYVCKSPLYQEKSDLSAVIENLFRDEVHKSEWRINYMLRAYFSYCLHNKVLPTVSTPASRASYLHSSYLLPVDASTLLLGELQTE